MMKKYYPFLLILVGFLTGGAWLFSAAVTREATAIPSREIVIIQTTDLHGNTGYGRPGSLLGVAQVIDSQRRFTPDTALLLIDCGDFAFGTIEGTASNGDFSLNWLNRQGYDAVIPGNHEFDAGYARFCQLIDSCPGAVLCANLKVEGTNRIVPWQLFERNGLRVAVIGLLTGETRHYCFGFDADSRIRLNDDFTAAADTAMREIMSAKPDLIVLACHAGQFTPGRQVQKFLHRYPQVNLVLGAHSHLRVPGEPLGRHSTYVQAGSHGTHVAIITVTLPQGARKPVVTSRLVETPPPTPEQKTDPTYRALLEELERPIRICPDTYLHSAEAMSQLLYDAVVARCGETVAILGRPRYTFTDTTILAWMIHAVSPYEDRLVSFDLTMPEIEAAMEDFKQLPISTRPRLFGGRTTTDTQRRFRVISTTYYAGGAGGKATTLSRSAVRGEANASILPWRIQDALRFYLKPLEQ